MEEKVQKVRSLSQLVSPSHRTVLFLMMLRGGMFLLVLFLRQRKGQNPFFENFLSKESD